MANPVGWFEVMGRDGAALRSFYAGLFDWQIAPAGERSDYGVVAAAANGILHQGIRLRTGIALPVPEVPVRRLVEIDDGRGSAVDRKVASAGGGDIPDSRRRPAKQILRPNVDVGTV